MEDQVDFRNHQVGKSALVPLLCMGYPKTITSGILTETQENGYDVLHAVAERAGGGFDYYRYRAGDSQWEGPFTSPGSHGNIHGSVIVARPDYLDVFYREVSMKTEDPASAGKAGYLYDTWTSRITPAAAYPFADDRHKVDEEQYQGMPGVCRWEGRMGLELVVPVEGGGIRHWYRKDDGSWHRGELLHRDLLTFTSCAILMGQDKELFVLAVDNNLDPRMWLIRRDAGNRWRTDELNIVGHGVSSNPAIVETNRNPIHKYDLVLTERDGGLTHYAVDADFKFTSATSFGGDTKAPYRRIGLIAEPSGWLHLVVQKEGRPPEHFERPIGEKWRAGKPFPSRITLGSWNVKHDGRAIGIHASLFHTGEVLLLGMKDDWEYDVQASILNAASGAVKQVTGHHLPHAFCGGHAHLPNGDLLIAGGHKGHEHVLNVFTRDAAEPLGWKFQSRPALHGGRWYPTCTTLPDGKVLIIGGVKNAGAWDYNNSYEIFDPAKPDAARPPVDLWNAVGGNFCDDEAYINMYPFVFVLPHETVFVHSRYTTRFFNYKTVTATGEWRGRVDANHKVSRSYPTQGTSVLLPLEPNQENDHDKAEVMIFGGSTIKDPNIDTPASDSVEKMTITPIRERTWTVMKKMPRPRIMPDAVLLPDGSVLIVNGSRAGRGEGYKSRQPELRVDLYHPATDTWEEMAPMKTPRLYHATAILLPDATVLVSGKCMWFQAHPYRYAEHRGEIFTPPYLEGNPVRPGITAAPSEFHALGGSFPITLDCSPASIKRVVLMRPSAATHSFNMDQRAIVLFHAPHLHDPTKLNASIPRSSWVAPPGYYMLFVINEAKVPSMARWIKVM